MELDQSLKAATGAAGETFVDVNPDGPTVVPGGDDLMLAEFARLGPDLQVTLPDGETVVVVDYFNQSTPPPGLATESGAVLNGDLVGQLAGPMVPDTQVAQTGASDALGAPAGAVDTLKGLVVAQRGGVDVQLEAGDPIYEGDVLVTGADAAVGIVFADESTMSMGGDARISIDQMVYDQETGGGAQLFDVVQGAFVFASGQIGKTDPDDVQVRTPVATIGIRGTKYAVNVDQDSAETSVTLFEGAVVVRNEAGEVLLNSIGQSTVVTSATAPPGDVFIMDAETQTLIYGDAIDFHPEAPALREDDDGGGEDDPNGDDLSADELEKLADELDDLDTAAGPGPSGAIAGFTQSALFLRLLNGVLEGADFTSGSLADDGFSIGSAFAFDLDPRTPLAEIGGIAPISGGFTSIGFPLGGGTVTYTYGGGNALVTGSSGFDLFSLDVTGAPGATGWAVGENSSGEVVISEVGGLGTQILMDGVEELAVNLGSGGDAVAIGSLTGTDIADSTVFVNAGAGDDLIAAADAGKRLVIDTGEGDDIAVGSSMNDDIRGGDGDDILDGGTGNDLLLGGAGDDTLLVTLEGGTVGPSQEPGSVIDFGNSASALGRTLDIVQGGTGQDTITVRFTAEQAMDPAFVEELIALKAHVEGEASDESAIFPTLGLSVSGVEAIVFAGAIPDADLTPALTLGGGEEDGSVALSLTLDGASDSPMLAVSVTLSGVPEGAVLTASDGTAFPGGAPISLTPAQLGDLSIALAPDSDEDFTLTATVESENRLTGDQAGSTLTGTVSVAGVADDPIVTVSNGSGTEDVAIGLSVAVAAGDADGSEALTVALQGLPVGSILTAADGTLLDPNDIPVEALSGLTLQPPLNYSGSLALTVIATSAEDGDSATVSQSFTVDIAGVADAPSLDVESALVGEEGDALPLSISAALSDTDGSESLTVTVTGLPQGFALSDGETSFTGSPVQIPQSALSSLSLLPAAGFAGSLALTVTATAEEADGDTASVSETIAVTLGETAAAPALSVLNAAGDEDGTIPLSISAAPGSAGDTVSVTIGGLPAGAVLTNAAGDSFTETPVTLTPAQLDGLAVTPPADSDADFTLTVTATGVDGEESASLSAQLTVTVDAVADTPSLTVSSVSGVEDVPVPLQIDAMLADTDGSESLRVEIDGLQSGFVLKDADGAVYSGDSVEVPSDALSGLMLVAPPNFYGSVQLTVRAIATEAAGGDTALVEKTITVGLSPEVDLPSLTVASAAGREDESIPLDIALTGTETADSVSVTIGDLPDGASLTNAAGESFTGDPVVLTPAQLDGLTVIPPQDSAADFDLKVTVTATEAGASRSATRSLDVTVQARADTPDLQVGDAQVVLGRAESSLIEGTDGDDTLIGGAGGDTLLGAAGDDTLIGDGDNLSATVTLDIHAALTDTDGSEQLTVTVSGLPGGVELYQGGELLVTGGQAVLASDLLDDVTLVVPPGTGDFDIQITARATDFDPEGGGDSATRTANIAVSVDDGSGLGSNDVLNGGDGDDTLLGGAGADVLISGSGSDVLRGGTGDDRLQVIQGYGDDIVDGGAGSDTLVLTVTDWDIADAGIVGDLQELADFVASGEAASGVRVFPNLGIEVKGIEALTIQDIDGNPLDVFGVTPPDPDAGITYTGDNDDNTAYGTENADTMSGGGGDDTLYGGGGNDVIDGGTGDDLVDGGAGDDTLDGGHGDDTVIGGAGDDVMRGGAGDDEIHADGGSDTVDAGAGDDLTVVTIDPSETGRSLSLDGGAGDDVLRIALESGHPDLQTVIAEIAAAGKAAHQDSVGPHEVASLGITFTNYEDVEITVDGAVVDFDPDLAASQALAVDTDALADGAAVLSDLEISDTDGDLLMQARVEISDGLQTGDALSVDAGLLSEHGLNLDVGADGVLTITGDAPLAAYQEVLRSVTLTSSDSVPEPGTRTLSVRVTDDDGNTASPREIAVAVTQPAAPSLADQSEEGRDTAAFLTAAGAGGATVTALTDLPSTATDTLTVTVGKLGNGGTGQFEVTVAGQVIGTFTTTVKATGGNGVWETIEISNVSLPSGAETEVSVSASAANSNVVIQSIAFGDTVVPVDPATATDGPSGPYAVLDPDGTPTAFALTPGGEDADEGSPDDWALLGPDGDEDDLESGDLDQRFDSVDMGDGEDWAVAAAGTEADINVDLSGGVWQGTENALGGAGDDVLQGNGEANLLAGGGGNDLLVADGGDDSLVGGAGDDTMQMDLADLAEAASRNAAGGGGARTLDQAIADAYEANDLDGAEALEGARAGVDGGSGSDLLRLTGGDGQAASLDGDMLAGAARNVEVLDVTQVDGPVDMALSVEDLVEMTDERDALTILKDGEDSVSVGGQQFGAGEHTISANGVDFKLTIEESEPTPDIS
jgi:Ca2+-binding RTX toxin-like protein